MLIRIGNNIFGMRTMQTKSKTVKRKIPKVKNKNHFKDYNKEKRARISIEASLTKTDLLKIFNIYFKERFDGLEDINFGDVSFQWLQPTRATKINPYTGGYDYEEDEPMVSIALKE